MKVLPVDTVLATEWLSSQDVAVSIDGNPLVIIELAAGTVCLCYDASAEVIGETQSFLAAITLFPMSLRDQTVYDGAFSAINEGVVGKMVVRGGRFDGFVGYFVKMEKSCE
jgi:hypothetical protein